jgi:hypothetical protein
MRLAGLVAICCGSYFLLGVYGVVPMRKNPSVSDATWAKTCKMIKILSPVMIVGGLLQLFGIL